MTLAAPAAEAQSTRLYLHGQIGAEYFNSTASGDGGMGLLDLTFGYAGEGDSALGGIGFEVGAFAYDQSASGSTMRGHRFYAAATMGLFGGRLSVGAPRSAAEGFDDLRLPGDSLSVALGLGPMTGTLSYATVFSALAENPILGLRYERSAGPLSYAVSAGRLSIGMFHADTYALGIAREFGQTRVFGSYERTDLPIGHYATAVLGFSSTLTSPLSSFGALDLGGAISQVEAGTNESRTVSLYATAHPVERLALSLGVANLAVKGATDTTMLGVDAAWDLWRGVALHAGVLHAQGTEIYAVGLRRNF